MILAFMTFLCFGWFMEGRPLEPEVSSWISRRLEEKGEMDLICRLAYLKWLSGRESLTGEQERQARYLLQECQQEGLRFAFCQKLPEKLAKAFQLDDKLFVEERFYPGDKVVLHYCIHRSGEQADRFASEPLKPVYQGIVSREFLLFYGKLLPGILQWSIKVRRRRPGERR